MPEPSPLSLGLVPPQLRAMGATKPLTQTQAIALLERIARWIKERVPTLKLDITRGADLSITIYAEVTGGAK